MNNRKKKRIQNRKKQMNMSIEEQQKEQLRFDMVIFIIVAIAMLAATVNFFVKANGFSLKGTVMLLFIVVFAWISFRSEIRKWATRKGWTYLATLSFSSKEEKKHIEALLREKRLKNPIDSNTVVLIESVQDLEQLEEILFNYVDTECDKLSENLPLLWKISENRYAITFPCGIKRQKFYELIDTIWSLYTHSVKAWCKPSLFKKNEGEWLYLHINDKDLWDATSDQGVSWEIDPEDAMLHNPRNTYNYHEYPEIDWDSAKQLGLYY